MLRRGFHYFKLAILILCVVYILAGCSENKTVAPASNPPQGVQEKQAAPVASATPEVNKAETVKEPVQSPSQILFLRIDPHHLVSNPYAKSPDLASASKDIWVMDPDGGNAVNLTKSQYNAESADWSPDKSQIVFDSVNSSLEGLPVCSVNTMNSDGSNVTKISPGATSRNFPAWSPDGLKMASSRYVVVSCNRAYPCKYFTLFTSDPNGSGDAQISFSPDNGYDLMPRWFPDSQQLAFLRNDTGYYQIYSGDIVKGGIHQYNIDGNPLYMPWFSLSPDASAIAYSHDLSRDYYHTGREIFIFDVKSGEKMQLTNNDYADDNPCFSPDGKQILFGAFGNSEETSGMFIMNADGTNVHKIPSSQYGDMPMQWK